MANRNFNREIRVMVDDKLAEKVKTIAGAKEKTVSEYVREALTNYSDLEYMQTMESKIQGFVATAVEEKLAPVENRLAKITAKTAQAAATSIFYTSALVQRLSQKYDIKPVSEVFSWAKKQGIAFVGQRVPHLGEMEQAVKRAKAEDVKNNDEHGN